MRLEMFACLLSYMELRFEIMVCLGSCQGHEGHDQKLEENKGDKSPINLSSGSWICRVGHQFFSSICSVEFHFGKW